MNLPRGLKTCLAILMSFLMTHIPAVAAADQKMISTISVVADLDRAESQAKVKSLLEKSEIQQALIERGVSPEEASFRLATLSDSELKQLSVQIEKAQAGGDILIAILVVVLIIFLIKRI